MVAFIMLLSFTTINAQTKNLKTETVKIYGNCGMCKTTIEEAGNSKKTAKVEWDKDSKMATITYDSMKTSKEEILKRIALAGYDSASFLAPDDVYAKLPECCQYDRELKTENLAKTEDHEMHNMKNMKMGEEKSMEMSKRSMPLSEVFEQYFKVKDALVATDSQEASASAKELNTAISNVKMGELGNEEHMLWMKILPNLTKDAKTIANAKDVEKQRDVFNSLSNNVYQLIKISKNLETVYYQYCPMKKMNWLSKDNNIKNPYYGAQMLSCGSTIETLK